jgi:nucleoid-associated protein YgaU
VAAGVAIATAEEPPETATMRRIEEAAPPSPPPPTATPSNTWTVRPGDHFWVIAEATLAQSLGRQPADGETAGYWRRLVETNQGRLADPSNPDLLFTGQVIELPDPAG